MAVLQVINRNGCIAGKKQEWLYCREKIGMAVLQVKKGMAVLQVKNRNGCIAGKKCF